MKVLSPVKLQFGEADDFHISEGNKTSVDLVRHSFLSRGLSPRYGVDGEFIGTWEILLPSGKTGKSANNPKRRGCGDGVAGSRTGK